MDNIFLYIVLYFRLPNCRNSRSEDGSISSFSRSQYYQQISLILTSICLFVYSSGTVQNFSKKPKIQKSKQKNQTKENKNQAKETKTKNKKIIKNTIKQKNNQ